MPLQTLNVYASFSAANYSFDEKRISKLDVKNFVKERLIERGFINQETDTLRVKVDFGNETGSSFTLRVEVKKMR